MSKIDTKPIGPLNDASPNPLIESALRLLDVADAYATWLANGSPSHQETPNAQGQKIVQDDRTAALRVLAVVVFAAQTSWPAHRISMLTTSLPCDIPLRLVNGSYAFVLNSEVKGGFPPGVLVGAFYSTE
ncbi:hypothetical protein C8J57DRAFT_1247522 [Mycena rebaudengoi]|nr:hypothetical protein C8J57DRAFT_1247522 [Mycena rebaudengoi]